LDFAPKAVEPLLAPMPPTVKPAKGSTMRRLILTLPLLGAGCATAVSDAAICEGTAQALAQHAAALSAADVPDDAVLTGARLIAQIDAGCGR
jgi:hypothetical protein